MCWDKEMRRPWPTLPSLGCDLSEGTPSQVAALLFWEITQRWQHHFLIFPFYYRIFHTWTKVEKSIIASLRTILFHLYRDSTLQDYDEANPWHHNVSSLHVSTCISKDSCKTYYCCHTSKNEYLIQSSQCFNFPANLIYIF